MLETLELILTIFLTIYVIALVVDEITYLCRGYRVVRYEPRRINLLRRIK